MIEFIQAGGVMMWPIVACSLLVLALAGRAAVLWRRSQARSDADAILVWGVAAAVLGILGTLVGVMQMATAIERAGMVQTPVVWSGIKVTLTTSIAGVGTLLMALMLWMGLRRRYE